jgi:hypothetical protein
MTADPRLIRRDVADGRVDPLPVVMFRDPPEHVLPSLRPGLPDRCSDLRFQDGEEAFRGGVVEAGTGTSGTLPSQTVTASQYVPRVHRSSSKTRLVPSAAAPRTGPGPQASRSTARPTQPEQAPPPAPRRARTQRQCPSSGISLIIGSAVSCTHPDMDGVGRFGWVTDPEGKRVELWQPGWHEYRTDEAPRPSVREITTPTARGFATSPTSVCYFSLQDQTARRACPKTSGRGAARQDQ